MLRVTDLAGKGEYHIELADDDFAALSEALERFRDLSPRVFHLTWRPDCYLQVGLGGLWGFVEYVEMAPWSARVAQATEHFENCPESVYFDAGGTPSEIPSGCLMGSEELIRCVLACIRQRESAVEWAWD